MNSLEDLLLLPEGPASHFEICYLKSGETCNRTDFGQFHSVLIPPIFNLLYSFQPLHEGLLRLVGNVYSWIACQLQVGVSLGHVRGHFGVILGLCWDHFGVILASQKNHFGIIRDIFFK